MYWFRRLLVLSVALGLVLGIAQLLGGSMGADEDIQARVVADEPSPRSTPAVPLSTEDARPDETKPAMGRKAEETKTETPLPEPSGPCADSDVVVTPEVPGPAQAGSPVTFRLLVSTVTSPACTWQVTPRTVAVKLVSGNDRIWSSQDCPAAVPTVEVVAREEKAAVVDVTWRGQRSDSSCSKQTKWAQPGYYHVQAAAFGAEPTDVQFELRPPVSETITVKPKPDKDEREKKQPENGRR